MLISKVIFYVTLVFSVMSCFPISSIGEEPKGDIGSLVNANTSFALDLYSKLKEEEGNLFFSPYSISTALAMTYGGARGNTAKQMAEVLHFTMGQEQLHPTFTDLEAVLQDVQKEGKVQLYIANSLWPQKDYPFRQQYLSLIQKHYGSSVTPVDFVKATEEARRIINTWVADETKKKITDLIRKGDLDPLTVLVLVNAIYFKGNWAIQFDPELTEIADFTLPGGGKKQVPMMHQRGTYGYRELDGLQVLELPYEGEQLSMCILLPRNPNGLSKLENSLSPEKVDSWLSDPLKVTARIFLPKFKIAWGTVELNKPLMALGIRDAFIGGKADFSGMDGTMNLFIDLVLHKAFVEVNEEGTEAAAATAVIMKKRAARIFRADHPFMFMIRDNATGSILFLGRVVDPS